MVGRNKEGLIPFIEKRAGVKFERTGAPQPADMARVAGETALALMDRHPAWLSHLTLQSDSAVT